MDDAENQTPVESNGKRRKVVMVVIKCDHCGKLREVTREHYLHGIVMGDHRNLCRSCAYQLPRLKDRLKRAKQIEKLKLAKLRNQNHKAPCGSRIEQSSPVLGADDPKRCESYYQCQNAHPDWYWSCLCHASRCGWRGWQFHVPSRSDG